jgi:FlaA1/EpsC-like NDP-sugar epimerase
MYSDGLWRFLIRILSRSGKAGPPVAVALDALTVAGCWHLGYLFRLGLERWQPGRPWYDDYVLAAITALDLLALAGAGLYRMPWRYFGFVDLSRIAGVFLGVGSLFGLVVVSAGLSGVARSVLVLHPVFCIVGLSTTRMVTRIVLEHAQRRALQSRKGLRKAVVIGAGDATRRLLDALKPDEGWLVLGIFCDDPASRGLSIAGIPVRGSLGEMAGSRALGQAHYVIVTTPRDRAEEHARAMRLAHLSGKRVIQWSQPQVHSEPAQTVLPQG